MAILITDIEFDQEMVELLSDMQESKTLVPLLMSLSDAWLEISDTLHDEVTERINQDRRARDVDEDLPSDEEEHHRRLRGET